MTHAIDKAQHSGRVSADQPVGAARDGLEYRLHVRRRAGDDLQDVGGGSLPLQRFPGLIEQPRILDRDQGLIAEGFGQSDFALTENTGSLSGQHEQADTFFTAEQRQIQRRVDAEHVADVALVFGQVDHRPVRQVQHFFVYDGA